MLDTDHTFFHTQFHLGKMAPTNKKTITDLHNLITEGIKKQEILEEGIKQINKKLDNLLESQNNNTNNTEEIKQINKKLDDLIESKTNNTNNTEETIQEKGEKNDEIATSLVKYFEENYGHLKEIGDIHIKEQAYLAKKENIPTWRTLLNDRKMNFYNAIKSAETALVYKNFLKMEEIYIPKKFREKTTPQDTEAQIRIKTHLNVQKVTADIHILEDKVIHYTNRYITIDKQIENEIQKSCPQITHPFLFNMWREDCEKEETTSKNILEKKIRWMIDLPHREKEMEKEKGKDRQKQKGDNRQKHQNHSHPRTDNRETQNYQHNRPDNNKNRKNEQYNHRIERYNQDENNRSQPAHQYNERHTHTNSEQPRWSSNWNTRTNNNDTHENNYSRPNTNRNTNTGNHDINQYNERHIHTNNEQPHWISNWNTRTNNNDIHENNYPRPNTNQNTNTGNHDMNRNHSNNHSRNNNHLRRGYQNTNGIPRYNNNVGNHKSIQPFLGRYHQGRNPT